MDRVLKKLKYVVKGFNYFLLWIPNIHVQLRHVTGILVLGLISFHHNFPTDTNFLQ
jgi:hypothetical protein